MKTLKYTMNPLPRRSVLRGIGGTAVALPWLEAMVGRKARAATPPRLILFFSPNGTIHDKWLPTRDAAGNITAMSSMLAPLDPYKSKLLMLTGIDMQSADANKNTGIDEGHLIPFRHMLTGKFAIPGGAYGDVGGISIDQAIAAQIGGSTRFKSIELGVQVPDTGDKRMSSLGPKSYVAPINDPKTAFTKFFTGVTPGGSTMTAPDPDLLRIQKNRQSILDYVKPDYAKLNGRLGAADRARLDQHITSLRTVETEVMKPVSQVTVSTAGCTLPNVSAAPKDATTFNPGPSADFMKIGYAQMDLLAAAIACNLTRVATLQWAGSGVYQPFLGGTFSTDHHLLSHDNQAAIQTIQTWYATHFAYLLNKLDSVQEDGGTLLDNTATVWFSDISHGYHTRYDIPYIIAGKAGGYFKTGRHVDLNPAGDHTVINGTRNPPFGPAHNNLFLNFAQMMGATAITSFGEPQFNKGPLALG